MKTKVLPKVVFQLWKVVQQLWKFRYVTFQSCRTLATFATLQLCKVAKVAQSWTGRFADGGSILSITFYWRCGREGSIILRMKWDSRVIQHMSFMTHVALKQEEHQSWIQLRTLCKIVQPTKTSGIICMWFGEWLSGNIKVLLNTSCIGTASQSMMKPDQLQGQS